MTESVWTDTVEASAPDAECPACGGRRFLLSDSGPRCGTVIQRCDECCTDDHKWTDEEATVYVFNLALDALED